jgi:hypothetical protein
MRASKPASPRVAASVRAGHLCRLLLLLPVILSAACASQDRLTARATGCSSRDVTIVSSDFQRQGVETAWCARCDAKVYQCATNADRSEVQCFEAKEGGPCR